MTASAQPTGMGGRRMFRSVLRLTPLALAAALVGASAFSCGHEPVRRDCFARIWVPRDSEARIAMERTGWEPSLAPTPYDDDWSLLRLDLPAGEYGYSIVRGAKPEVDRNNPLTTFREDTGEEVSLLLV